MTNCTKPESRQVGRVTKLNPPEFALTRRNYRKALPYLLSDFDGRCAYSLVHARTIGDSEMHVDHFDPSKKKNKKQDYANLRPACAHCNIKKWENWPPPKDQRQGIRFLDCRTEHDYDVEIFEIVETGELVGKGTAARYHIEVLDLNAPHLMRRRRVRTHLRECQKKPVRFKLVAGFDKLRELLDQLEQILSMEIPFIKPPPSELLPTSGIRT